MSKNLNSCPRVCTGTFKLNLFLSGNFDLVKKQEVRLFFSLTLFWEKWHEGGKVFSVNSYSKVSIKRPVLSNHLVLIFPKSLYSIKRPGPSQKKSIVLFYFKAATANLWSLSNDLVWMFGKVSIKQPVLSFFQILEA